jgi:hypothetical protein
MFGSALLGAALLSCGFTLAVTIAVTSPHTTTVVQTAAAAKAPAAGKHANGVLDRLPQAVRGTARVVLEGPPLERRQTVALGAKRTVISPSFYLRTTAPPVLREQGCRLGHARTKGLVILDFGKLAYRPKRGGYGTLTFADRFASTRSITWAMKSFARGYSECLPKWATAKLIVARGTSNYNQNVPSTYTAGRIWAQETAVLGTYLTRHGFDDHVTAAAADDVEPAWDRTFHRTRDFFRGYRAAKTGYLLYNYGSLDGGAGAIWTVRQAYFVAGGMRYARAVPEIYNHSMAQQWADLSRISVERFGRPIQFAGLMTQHWKGTGGFTAEQAHAALVRELGRHPKTAVRRLAAVTNIGAQRHVT